MKYTHVSYVSDGYVPTEYTLWWTWRESNPRPECLHFEGITTILYLRLAPRLAIVLTLLARGGFLPLSICVILRGLGIICS